MFLFTIMEIQKIESRQELLLKTLHKYYYKDNNLRKMLNILNGDNKISLRLIDYFVTNYAKNNHTIYIRKVNENEEEKDIPFYIYREYRNQLKAYSKLLFDPFCRRDRIELKYNDGTLTTTIGQLNFFRWMLDNELIKYIKTNKKTIEEEMSNKKKNKKDNKKNPVYKYKLKVAVHFEDETSSEATTSQINTSENNK
mgnify:FL=1